LETWREKNRLPRALCFSLAALIKFYGGDGSAYEIRDDEPVLTFFAENKGLEANGMTRAFLSRTDFWGEDLSLLPNFKNTVASYLDTIQLKGMREALKQFLDEVGNG
jgi:tagaturonate reductase